MNLNLKKKKKKNLIKVKLPYLASDFIRLKNIFKQYKNNNYKNNYLMKIFNE